MTTCASKLYIKTNIIIPMKFPEIIFNGMISGTVTLIRNSTGDKIDFPINLSDKNIYITDSDIQHAGKYFLNIEIMDQLGLSRRLTPCPSHLIFEP